MAANEPNIRQWFAEYTQVLKDLNIQSPNYIWSGDETGVLTIPKEENYLGEVNEPLYNQVAADQGETSTVLALVNAIGHVYPPLVIHKGQRVQGNWANRMPAFMKLAATSKDFLLNPSFMSTEYDL